MSDPFDFYNDPVFEAMADEEAHFRAEIAEGEEQSQRVRESSDAAYRAAYPGGLCSTCFYAKPCGPERLTCTLVEQRAFSNQRREDFPRVETNHQCPDGNEEVDAYLVVPPDFGCNRHVERCHACGGIGGDCDAGDDGRTISWACADCGGTGRESLMGRTAPSCSLTEQS